jgi:putative Mg2+ transporter-C (MgtC) family protein
MLDGTDIAVRLAAAVAAGAVLGWERESQQKPAGLRTHMLVTLGAAGFVLAGIQLHEELVGKGQAGNSDLMKVIGGIVGGVGFLGAGSIIRAGGNVHGLTTAATIWLAAAIGVVCGLGLYVQAITMVGLALAILFMLGVIERTFFPNPNNAPPGTQPDKPSTTQQGGPTDPLTGA